MKEYNYTQRQKNAFLKRHNLENLLPELNRAINFDVLQLLQRNSAEVNKTLRIAALRTESERLTELGQQVLHFLLETVDGIKWEKGRIAIGKKDVTLKSEAVFTDFIETAKAEAEAMKKAQAEEKAKAQAEAEEKKKAEAEAKREKAAEAKAIAEANKSDELAQAEAATAVFEAKAAQSKLVASDKNISVKAAQAMLHGLVVGNLKVSNLQEVNDTLKLLQLAAQAVARQAASVPNVEADETRVAELAKTKATGKEKTATKKVA